MDDRCDGDGDGGDRDRDRDRDRDHGGRATGGEAGPGCAGAGPAPGTEAAPGPEAHLGPGADLAELRELFLRASRLAHPALKTPPLCVQKAVLTSLAALLDRYREGTTTGGRVAARRLAERCRRWIANAELDEGDFGPGPYDRPGFSFSPPAEVRRQLQELRDLHRDRVETRKAWDREHAGITGWFEVSARDRDAREERARLFRALGPTPPRPTRTAALLGLAARAASPREHGVDLPLLVGAVTELHTLLYGSDGAGPLTLYDRRFEDSSLTTIPAADAVDLRTGARVGESALASLAKTLAGSADPGAVEAVCRMALPGWPGLTAAVLEELRFALVEGGGGRLRDRDAPEMPPWWREGLGRTYFRLGGESLRKADGLRALTEDPELRACVTFQALADRRGASAAGRGGLAPPDLGWLWVRDHQAFLEFCNDPGAAVGRVAQVFVEALEDAACGKWRRREALIKCADAVRGLGLGFGDRPWPTKCEVEALDKFRDRRWCSGPDAGEFDAAVELLREALRAACFLATGSAPPPRQGAGGPAGGGGGGPGGGPA